METKGDSEQRSIQNSGSVLKLRRLVGSAVVVVSVGIASYATGFAIAKQESDSKASIQQVKLQAKLCRKFNRGEVQAEDAAAGGKISGVHDILADLQTVQVELAKKRLVFVEEQPTIVTLKAQEAALKSLLKQRIDGICNVVN
jgi:capsule polysaccharide export protein KpsE/RkpR